MKPWIKPVLPSGGNDLRLTNVLIYQRQQKLIICCHPSILGKLVISTLTLLYPSRDIRTVLCTDCIVFLLLYAD